VDVVREDTGETVWTAFTTGDGVAPYYPELVVPGWGRPAPGSPERAPLQVVVSAAGQAARARWAPGEEALRLRLPVEPRAEAAVPVDVCFIIDTTGSMGDEIARVQQTLLSLTQRLRGSQAVDLRYGAVLYRDVGDQYLTMAHPMTGDLLAFDQAIQEIQAGGGGDGPESLNQGLAVAVSDMDWRPGAAKVAFLIADAPPHMDYQEPVTYGRAAAGAAHKGVRVHTVAASGLDDAGSAVFLQIAQITRGRFIFIEYGSTAASAADHGVTGTVASNNLDQILYDRIRAEVEGWRGGRTVAAR
jgi:Mg-chelatase subunit ChlD